MSSFVDDEAMRRAEETHERRRAAAAARAQAKEDAWDHPRVMEGLLATDDLAACADPYCRYCKDQDGEVRDGFRL